MENLTQNLKNLDSEKPSFFDEKVSSSNSKEDCPKLQFKNEIWQRLLFKDTFTFLPNNTLSRNELSEEGLINNIHYGDILIKYGDCLDVSIDKIPYININSNAKYNKSYLNNGDVIFADTAEDETVGKAVELYNITTENIVSGLHTMPCRPRLTFASKFLGYYLNSPFYHRQLFTIMQGIKVTSISKGNIVNTKISFPSVETQEKISKFLSLVDKRIDKQRQLVENLKKYKRGLLFSLFDKKIKFKNKDTYYTKWEEKKIKEVFNITRGYVLPVSEISTSKNEEYIYPVYSSQTKNDGLMGYYNKYLYCNAITWTTDGANAGFTKYREGKFYCTNVCGVLINEVGYANYYIAEKLNSITRRHVSYVGNPKLMNNVMADIKIEFPSIEEQNKLSKIISILDKKINLQELYLEKLCNIKNGLLQQMFI